MYFCTSGSLTISPIYVITNKIRFDQILLVKSTKITLGELTHILHNLLVELTFLYQLKYPIFMVYFNPLNSGYFYTYLTNLF